jgi:hypothetical protein
MFVDASGTVMKRLVFLLLLGSCAGAADTPPSPALRDVKISYVHADPAWIRHRGQSIGLARSRDKTLAFATLRRLDKTCVITLPYPWTVDEALYRRLRTHEERHCHGEEHRAAQFPGEEPFE